MLSRSVQIARIRRSIERKFEVLQANRSVRGGLLASLFFALVVVTTLMFPSGQSLQFANLKEGNVYTGKEIIVPFTFFIKKSEEVLAEDRKRASEKIALVFTRNDII